MQEAWVYSHDGPIRRKKRGYILATDQSLPAATGGGGSRPPFRAGRTRAGTAASAQKCSRNSDRRRRARTRSGQVFAGWRQPTTALV
eukprot:5670837-Pyramimonas_sp.AAC.1